MSFLETLVDPHLILSSLLLVSGSVGTSPCFLVHQIAFGYRWIRIIFE